MNNRFRFFIPSTQNYFDKFQVRTAAMHDTGCNSHLLAISYILELTTILQFYEPKSLVGIVEVFAENMS